MATRTIPGISEGFVREFVRDLKNAVYATMCRNWEEDDSDPTLVDHGLTDIKLYRIADASMVYRQYNYGDRHITCFFEAREQISLNDIEFAVLNFNGDHMDMSTLDKFRPILNLAMGKKMYAGSFTSTITNRDSFIHKLWAWFKHVFKS